MNIKALKVLISKIFQTTKNIILFRLNGLLTSLSIFLESETFDNIRMRYGNWYNLQLMRKFIDCDYYLKNRHIILNLLTMETIGTIVIANIHYQGMTSQEMNEYLVNTIGGFIPGSLANIQVSSIDKNHAKIIFPI